MQRYLDSIYPNGSTSAAAMGANQAFVSLALHRNAAEISDTNERLAAMLKPFVQEGYWITTPENDLRLYWQQTMLIKLLLDPRTRDRLSPENHALIKQLLWNFVQGFASTYIHDDFASTDPTKVAWIHESDNHDIIKHGFFFFACQLLKDDPAFADKALPGGMTPATLYLRWSANLKIYFRQRASAGMVAEIASPGYAGVYLQSILLFADYAADPEVRALAISFLDLTFADAAQETLNGMRGGARSRAYKDANAYDGRADTLVMPLYVLTGQPASGALYPLRPGFIPPRDCFGILDTGYRLPGTVLELFNKREEMKNFQFDSQRPAIGTSFNAAIRGVSYPIYVPVIPSRFVRSTFITPAYTLGWFTIDESQPALLIHDQNEWMGAITSADNGRLAITGTPTSTDGRTSYHDLQAVGQSRVMIVRRGVHAQGNGPLRIFFSADFQLENQGGWLFAKSGDDRAWFALKTVAVAGNTLTQTAPVESNWGTTIPGATIAGHFYIAPSPQSFVIVESGSAEEGTYADFVRKIVKPGRISVSAATPGITYQPIDGTAELTLYQNGKIPQIGSRPLAWPNKREFASPFLESDENRQRFTVRSPSGRSLVIDFARHSVE